MPKTRLDESRWPLVVFTAVGEQSDDDFEAYLADADRLLRRREPHGLIFDARRANIIGPKLRRRQAEWLRDNEALLRAYVVACGLVMSTALQRGVFRAITWMKPYPAPHSVEASFDAAQRFVSHHLAKRGCAVPPMFGWDHVLRKISAKHPPSQRRDS